MTNPEKKTKVKVKCPDCEDGYIKANKVLLRNPECLCKGNGYILNLKVKVKCPEFKATKNGACFNMIYDSPFCANCTNTEKFGYKELVSE